MSKMSKLMADRRYGMYYVFERLLTALGVHKELPHKAVMKRQQYYMDLKPEQYPEELKKWYKKASGGRDLDLDNPKRLTEKIQWLKLYDSTAEKSHLADKYLVREHVAKLIGEEYLIPLLGVWDKAEDIDFDKLPDQFVLKCNHGSATNILVRDKAQLDIKKTVKTLNEWMEIEYGMQNGSFELHYNAIQKKIIAEAFMVNEGHADLCDYKFYCFDGDPYCVQVIGDRSKHKTIDFFDADWKHLPFTGLAKAGNAPTPPPKPATFEKMKAFARILSKGFCFVRVDFYECSGKLYFGELTFTPNSGSGSFDPDEWDEKLGSMMKLPRKGEN